MVRALRKTLAASALSSVLVVSMGCSEQPLAPSPTSEPSGATTNTTATTGAGGAGGGSSITRPKHVLIVIADDLGVDQLLAYNDENNDENCTAKLKMENSNCSFEFLNIL